MSVTVDGTVIEVTPFDKNIVEVAGLAKIRIPAPVTVPSGKMAVASEEIKIS
jgi:hypothetical protein